MKTKPNPWMEIVTLSTAGACAVALLFASLGAAAGAAGEANANPQEATQAQAPSPASAAQQTYDGFITCSRCGAKHPAASSRNASDCTRICVHGGANFALIDGDEVYILEGNLSQVKKVAGQRAAIIGILTGHTIKVSSVAAGT
jgi:hypothetical protein